MFVYYEEGRSANPSRHGYIDTGYMKHGLTVIHSYQNQHLYRLLRTIINISTKWKHP